MDKGRASILKKGMHITLACGVVLYPLIIYFGLNTFSPRLIAILCGTMVIAVTLLKQHNQDTLRLLAPLIGAFLLCLLSAFFNRSRLMLYLPALISLNLLISFGHTWFRPRVWWLFLLSRPLP